jgi:CrcB protein
MIASAADDRAPFPSATRAFLLVGLLGGFTTFSSYTSETFVLIREAQFLRAAANASGQVFFGLAALWAGYALVRAL